ncbi:uncharacterized protein LOC110839767 [Zootermopsis nevadensis]|uniref:uncharacterized protein LOC110839767 n=1 Tax=Zootermopsis nevadensis TaxID=136037 RepID=UPI000B8E7120|nr:uncharacterized protein LOC110839767 [Zootermopsis nevadensis]
MLVPCPKPIPGMEKIMTTFSLSVWLTMGLVFVLTTSVFWFVANGPHVSTFKELEIYKSISLCFYNAWAVFMGVSVTQLPTTSKLRAFFFIYVSYCFAMSTVFQAFFVSYLVEPEAGKEIKTFDELLKSDIAYGYHSAWNYILHGIVYPEFSKFHERKETRKDCNDFQKCVQKMITQHDRATMVGIVYSTYIASELGIADPSTVICSFDENLIYVSIIMLLKKGSPFLDMFNVLIRRSLEAGLQERHWSELKHQASLRGGDRLKEESNMFVIFSVSHLTPAFVVLISGNILSFGVFVIELIHNWYWKKINKGTGTSISCVAGFDNKV